MSTELSNLLLKRYTKILETGEFSDTEILVGKEPNVKPFRLHSFILKVCSPYFRSKLSNNSINIENNIIKFHESNISVEIFEILIKYIYVGKLDHANIDFKTNVDLLIAAFELRLIDLCHYMDAYLLNDKKSLKSNFVLILHITKKFPQLKKLSEFYTNTDKQDPSLIFKTSDFTKIKQEYLLMLIKSNQKAIENSNRNFLTAIENSNRNFLTAIENSNRNFLTAIEIWDKLVEWVIAQSDELPSDTSDITNWTDENILTFGTLIQPFIPHIKYKEINRYDFSRKIKPFKKIFDDKFYIEILEYYCFGRYQKVRDVDPLIRGLREGIYIIEKILFKK